MGEKSLLLKLYFSVFAFAFFLFLLTVHRLPEINQISLKLIERNEMKDWHDYNNFESDRKRHGLGEHGKPAYIKDKQLKKLERNISLKYGYNGLLSDMISLNRTLRDIRHKGCTTKKYLASLPTVSIIIPFYNECLSVLLRSVHSIINRSPSELLREIILVDDASTYKDLQTKLDNYITENFSKVNLIRLSKRTGLIGARLIGARKARAEILIFFDAHIEVNYNWLPPLLEPIAQDQRTVVCPFIDVIDDHTFEYMAQDEGARGAFNWVFDYKRIPLTKNDQDGTIPFENPVMAGGLFAISAKFFWKLGGYDEDLRIWGGEQYELSFKIWMCGGLLLDAPCSRIGHIYRGRQKSEESSSENYDYLRRNHKRVAEVWMDEYKQFVYDHDPVFNLIDPGDIRKQKELRAKLKCKSFKWYMENVAYDLITLFPTVEPPNYAFGVIQSLRNPILCVDTLNNGMGDKIGLFNCAENLTYPHKNQNWVLSSHRDIRLDQDQLCLTVKSSKPNAPVLLWECEEEGGDQFWYYNLKNQWIIFELNGKRCLEALTEKHKLVVNKCEHRNTKMRWKFGYVNTTALHGFFTNISNITYFS